MKRTWVFIALAGALLVPPTTALPQNETRDLEVYKTQLNKAPQSPEARAQLAAVLERKKDYKGMVELLAGYKDKIGRGGLVLLSRAYGKQGQRNDEVAVLELANARYPKDAQLQTLLSGALARAGRKDEAIESYYKAKTAHPKYIPAFDGLLTELIAAESRQEARDLLEDMTKRFGLKPKWSSQLCALYTADAFLEKAVETCQTAMKKDRDNPNNAVNLANTFREQGEPEKARKTLVSAATRIRKSEPVQSALGAYFVEKKNYVDAFRWFKAGVKNDPKSLKAQLGLAQSAIELQKMEDAVIAFSAACRLERQSVREFQTALGRIRQRGDVRWQSRFEEAIAQNCQPGL